MLKNTSDLSCREDGFTLIELLIVIVIIGILAAIAIPVFLSQAQNARNASVESDVRNAATQVGKLAALKGFDATKYTPATSSEAAKYDGEPLVTSKDNVLALSANGTNGYTLSGWNTDAEKFTVTYTSATGKFSQDKTTAESVVGGGAGTGGNGTGGTGGSATPATYSNSFSGASISPFYDRGYVKNATVSSTEGHDAPGSMMVELYEDSEGYVPFESFRANPAITLDFTKTYKMSAWVKLDSTPGQRVFIDLPYADNGTPRQSNVVSGSGWQKIELELSAQEVNSAPRFTFYTPKETVVYVDDFRIDVKS